MRLRGGTMAMVHNVKTVEKAAFQFPLLLFYFSLGEASSPGNCHAPFQKSTEKYSYCVQGKFSYRADIYLITENKKHLIGSI